MNSEQVKTGLDIDDNYETLSVAVKKGDVWHLDVLQMPRKELVLEGETIDD